MHVLHLVDEVVPRTCQVGDESPRNVLSPGDFCASHCGNVVVEGDEASEDGNVDPDDACTNVCGPGPLSTLPRSVRRALRARLRHAGESPVGFPLATAAARGPTDGGGPVATRPRP